MMEDSLDKLRVRVGLVDNDGNIVATFETSLSREDTADCLEALFSTPPHETLLQVFPLSKERVTGLTSDYVRGKAYVLEMIKD